MSGRRPEGPTSAFEYLHYPLRLAELFLRDADVLLPEMKTLPLSGHGAAKSFLGPGVELYTRYSGMGMAEIACHLYQGALAKESNRFGMDYTWEGFKSMQAWDVKPSARKMLLDLEPGVVPQCIFGDMLLMLPSQLRETINGLAVAAGENKQTFWNDLRALFPEVEAKLLHCRMEAFCHRHLERRDIGIDRNSSFTGLRLCIAGVTCKDFSAMHAKRKGVLGPSGLPLLNFIFDVRRNKFDIVVTECTPMQDLKPFEDFLSALYTTETFCLGPEDLGAWTTRRRRFVVFWLRPEHGGKVTQGLPMALLKKLVARRRPDKKYNNMYMVAPASHQALVKAETARASKMTSGLVDSSGWEACLNATKQTRLQLQRMKFLERHGMAQGELDGLTAREIKGLVRRFQKEDGHETWVDLDQTPSTAWGKQSIALPTLLSHGSIYGLGANRCLLADELMVSQGLDVLGVAVDGLIPSPSKPPWRRIFWPELSEAAKKDLCGNTINCEVLMCIIGFIIRVATPVGMKVADEDDMMSANSHVVSPGPTAKRSRVRK